MRWHGSCNQPDRRVVKGVLPAATARSLHQQEFFDENVISFAEYCRCGVGSLRRFGRSNGSPGGPFCR
jgi:hypothetical protein